MDTGFEVRDGFEFTITDPSMSPLLEDRNAPEAKQQWKSFTLLFTNMRLREQLSFTFVKGVNPMENQIIFKRDNQADQIGKMQKRKAKQEDSSTILSS